MKTSKLINWLCAGLYVIFLGICVFAIIVLMGCKPSATEVSNLSAVSTQAETVTEGITEAVTEALPETVGLELIATEGSVSIYYFERPFVRGLSTGYYICYIAIGKPSFSDAKYSISIGCVP